MKPGFDVVEQVLFDLNDAFADIPSMQKIATEVGRELTHMREVMLAKGEDYSGQGHTFTNFELNAELTHTSTDMVFLHLMGVKFSRLASLLETGQKPNHESIDDTWLDLANYIVLYIAYMRWRTTDALR